MIGVAISQVTMAAKTTITMPTRAVRPATRTIVGSTVLYSTTNSWPIESRPG